MPSSLTTPPAAEPVTLAEAKAHLRVTDAAEDGLISTLITAARRHAEAATGLAFITQSWTLALDRWPETAEVGLPRWPLISIAALRVYGDDNAAMTIDPAHYFADPVSRPARLVRRGSRAWAPPGRVANGIEIEAVYGYGAAAAVPAPLKQAMLALIAHWFENRGDGPSSPPLTAAAILRSYRSVGL